ncbi:hypothetical protein LUZ60_010571 [Juncus effusus]|nr:hypothetical protein LUZ60_010571 [Juncus effusus]
MAGSLLSYSFLLLILFSCTIQVSLSARTTPHSPQVIPNKDIHAKDVSSDKKETDCVQEGTVAIPGVGRYELGTSSVPMPDLTNWDHSIPAAMHAHYLPGADDTFLPNPGFEIPNPFNPSGP